MLLLKFQVLQRNESVYYESSEKCCRRGWVPRFVSRYTKPITGVDGLSMDFSIQNT